MVALIRVSDMFFGLLIHSSGVVRLLKIWLVSESLRACLVIFRALFSSCLKPLVLGERVSLNTNGVVLLFCGLLWFCFVHALSSSSALLVGVKYCCMPIIVCALLHN